MNGACCDPRKVKQQFDNITILDILGYSHFGLKYFWDRHETKKKKSSMICHQNIVPLMILTYQKKGQLESLE